MSGARGHQARYVYVAEGACLVKIGVTKDIKRRSSGLRNHHGRLFEIVKHWEHRDPLAIEAMVREVLSMSLALGFEGYSVSRDEMVLEVEEAIARYDRLEMTDQTSNWLWHLRVLRIQDNRSRGLGPMHRAWNHRNKST